MTYIKKQITNLGQIINEIESHLQQYMTLYSDLAAVYIIDSISAHIGGHHGTNEV